jgi:hypothetical protein
LRLLRWHLEIRPQGVSAGTLRGGYACAQGVTPDTLRYERPVGGAGPAVAETVPAANYLQQSGLTGPPGGTRHGALAGVSVGHKLLGGGEPLPRGPVQPQGEHDQHTELFSWRGVGVVPDGRQPRLDHRTPPAGSAVLTATWGTISVSVPLVSAAAWWSPGVVSGGPFSFGLMRAQTGRVGWGSVRRPASRTRRWPTRGGQREPLDGPRRQWWAGCGLWPAAP